MLSFTFPSGIQIICMHCILPAIPYKKWSPQRDVKLIFVYSQHITQSCVREISTFVFEKQKQLKVLLLQHILTPESPRFKFWLYHFISYVILNEWLKCYKFSLLQNRDNFTDLFWKFRWHLWSFSTESATRCTSAQEIIALTIEDILRKIIGKNN